MTALSDYTGMSAGADGRPGQTLGGLDHLRQSVRDILLTPIGTRVMRREYGSALMTLVDAPMDRALILDIIQATAEALERWEPRVRVERVHVQTLAPGRLELDLALRERSSGRSVRLAQLRITRTGGETT